MMKFSGLSTCLPLVMGALVLAPVAIADPVNDPVNETVFEAMPPFEPIPANAQNGDQSYPQDYNYVNLPGQITPDAQLVRFNSQPFANVETITLSDTQKTIPSGLTVAEEANADAPKSESYNSGFKIRIGLDDQTNNTPTE